MKAKILSFLIFMLLCSALVFSQAPAPAGNNNIILSMAPFANQNYLLLQHKGNRADTLAKGTIGMDGMDTIRVSNQIKKGTATLQIAGGQKMLILVGEDNFRIINNGVGVGFENSRNNQILVNYFTANKADINNDNSFATQYVIIDQFIKRLDTLIPYDNVMVKDAMKKYIEEELNIESLYLSGRWKDVFQKIHILYNHPTDYARAMTKVAGRTESQEAFEYFSEFLMNIYESAWSAREIYGNFLLNSGRTFSPKSTIPGALRMYKLKIGDPAPRIFGKVMTSSIVVFHETGNKKSQAELELLKSKYRQLRIQGYDIVSISADIDKDVFAIARQGLPWINKLCDYEGYNGKEFVEYGITIIPTIYIIDRMGNIGARHASISEVRL